MKLLRWVLPLLFLCVFAMPVLGMDTGPPGSGIVIDQKDYDFNTEDVDMSDQVAAYKKKRDMVFDALTGPFGLVKPQGAFYAFVGAPKDDAGAFVAKAIANNVLIIPGSVFSRKDTHFRLSYATTDEKLAQGLEILTKLA